MNVQKINKIHFLEFSLALISLLSNTSYFITFRYWLLQLYKANSYILVNTVKPT